VCEKRASSHATLLLPGSEWRPAVSADGPDGEQGLGYLWDAAIRAKLSVRSYGFFLDLGAVQGLDPTLTDPCSKNPPIQVAFPAHTSLLDRTDFCFRGFDQSFPDFFRFQEWHARIRSTGEDKYVP
jgi:hypothetical protein